VFAGYDRRMTDPCVTASVHVAAGPDVVYRLVTDLPTLASLAEEAVAMEWRKGSAVSPGAVFTGHNEAGSRRWSTWDRRPGWFRKVAGRATGVTDRVAANTEHIQLTLQRLKQRAETE
jgi:hypothetical protein